MKEFDKLILVQYISWCSVVITYIAASKGYTFVILAYFIALALGIMRYNKPNKTSVVFYQKPLKYWRNQSIFCVVFLGVSVPLVFFQESYSIFVLVIMLVIDFAMLTISWKQINVVKSLELFES